MSVQIQLSFIFLFGRGSKGIPFLISTMKLNQVVVTLNYLGPVTFRYSNQSMYCVAYGLYYRYAIDITSHARDEMLPKSCYSTASYTMKLRVNFDK